MAKRPVKNKQPIMGCVFTGRIGKPV